MTARATSHDIDQTASEWAARLDRGTLRPDEEAALEAWLAGDSRCKGALLRAQAVAMMSESARALGSDFDPKAFAQSEQPARTGVSRRGALAWTGGAAALGSLVAFGFVMPAPAGAVISTERGEIRLVPLKDGSTVLLNTESSIRVSYGQRERTVTLLNGEAYFSVARDEQRPFIVDVNGRRLRTAQAGFRVRRLNSFPIDVLVHQGEVDIADVSPTGFARRLAIKANSRLILPAAGGGSATVERPERLMPEVVNRELAWREGKLAFEGETLKEAAESFARYSDTRIDIPDPVLAREPVTGLFAANDPIGFSRAIAGVFDARVRRDGDRIVLMRDTAIH